MHITPTDTIKVTGIGEYNEYGVDFHGDQVWDVKFPKPLKMPPAPLKLKFGACFNFENKEKYILFLEESNDVNFRKKVKILEKMVFTRKKMRAFGLRGSEITRSKWLSHDVYDQYLRFRLACFGTNPKGDIGISIAYPKQELHPGWMNRTMV